jgi:replication factor C small subunit
MRLSHTYQPETLDEVVGQPGVIRRLKAVVARPSPCCILLEGRGGVGKSAAAAALIRDLGVSEFGVQSLSGAKLRIELVEQLFYQTFRYRPMAGAPWHILLIEEMELLPSKNVNSELKDQLSEQNHPERLIVIATSNDASGLDEALLQRFDIYPFSCGPSFADACADRLNEIWEKETGGDVPMPPEVTLMGWRNNSYSMRRALSALGAAVEMHRASRAKEVAAC